MIYIKFTVGDDPEVITVNYPRGTLVNQVIYQTKQKYGRDINIVTVGAFNKAPSDWEPDPSWPIIRVQPKKRKTFFGRYVD